MCVRKCTGFCDGYLLYCALLTFLLKLLFCCLASLQYTPPPHPHPVLSQAYVANNTNANAGVQTQVCKNRHYTKKGLV